MPGVPLSGTHVAHLLTTALAHRANENGTGFRCKAAVERDAPLARRLLRRARTLLRPTAFSPRQCCALARGPVWVKATRAKHRHGMPLDPSAPDMAAIAGAGSGGCFGQCSCFVRVSVVKRTNLEVPPTSHLSRQRYNFNSATCGDDLRLTKRRTTVDACPWYRQASGGRTWVVGD